MKLAFTILITFGLPALACYLVLVGSELCTTGAFQTLYDEELRGPMFSALFSLAGFLLTMSTFIIITMKQGVYDTPNYRAHIKESRKTRARVKHYGRLFELSAVLSSTILALFFAAIMQITLGLAPGRPSQVAVACAVGAMGMVSRSLWDMWANLRKWFEVLESPPPHGDTTSGAAR